MSKHFSVSFPLPLHAARDIIAEAESNYWLQDYRPRWDYKACRLILRRREGEGESNVPAKVLTITHVSIARALSLALSRRANRLKGDNCFSIGAEIVQGLCGPGKGCGADGPTKDALLQIAVFGAVVYG